MKLPGGFRRFGIVMGLCAIFGGAIADAAEDPKSYTLELRSSVNYKSGTGKVSSSPTDTGTEINDVHMQVDLGLGFVMGDTMEPLFEVNYKSANRKLATFVGTDTSMSYGLGVLFNMPVVSDRAKTKKKDSEEKSDERTDFAKASWIPYLGFLLSSDTVNESRGTNSQFEVTDGNLVTKLVVGIRWMIYPHVGLNFSTRASYQKQDSSAKTDVEEGGAINKLEIEARLMEMSLFF